MPSSNVHAELGEHAGLGGQRLALQIRYGAIA